MKVHDQVVEFGRRAVKTALSVFARPRRRKSSMTLKFPNSARSYDERRKAVGFVAYDGVFEIRFFVEAAALAKGAGQDIYETKCLLAFDELRDSIHEVAREAYANRRLSCYTLSTTDFR